MKTLKIKEGSSTEKLSMWLCFAAYVAIYLGRYSYSANIGLIEESYGVTHANAGLVMTFFSVAYGTGQLINGFFVKKYPRRITVPIILGVAATMDILVFCGIPFRFIKYIWLFGAICQSALWPFLIQVISENVGGGLINEAILLMNTTTSFGTLFVYGISAYFAKRNFRFTFLFGAAVLCVIGFLWLIFFPKGNFSQKTKENRLYTKSKYPVTRDLAFLIGILVLFSILINFGKDGLQTWLPVILKNLHCLGDDLSIILTLVLPLFGIFGAAFSVFMHRKIPKIIPLMLLYFGLIAGFELLATICKNQLFILLGTFGVLELLLHGACSIITSIFPLEMHEKVSAGSLSGILNGSAYVGSATSSYVLGKIADLSGWTAAFIMLIASAIFALIVGVVYLIIVKHKEL